ncbi:YaaC family protein [Aeromonas salmonicida]|uniref:YaaC family protein n=1 Tax=Aeromonas salmonicida TaxID=645 RepID=UPI003D31F1E4
MNHEDIDALQQRINEIDEKFTPVSPRPTIKYKNKPISIKKPKISADFESKTVLTDSTWQYVEIYLRSKGQIDALFYWEQAKNFYESTKHLSIISKPLTAYYCFLNATKALLEVKNTNYSLSHGVSGKRNVGHINIINEIIKFQPSGVVSALSQYLGENIPAGGEEYTLKEVLYNIPYIHRAFKLTYNNNNMAELFIPITDPIFVHDKLRRKAWLQINLEPEHSNRKTLGRLIGYSLDNLYDNTVAYTLRRNKSFDWDAPRNKPTAQSLDNLKLYHKKIRKELRYIYSPNDLWYVKRKDLTNNIINKSSLTLTIGAMHRLSELSRYEPQTLSKHLSKDASWLISEFINKSIYQFIDQISSEITGNNFRVTGFRA